jgi:hypothetical protein
MRTNEHVLRRPLIEPGCRPFAAERAERFKTGIVERVVAHRNDDACERPLRRPSRLCRPLQQITI